MGGRPTTAKPFPAASRGGRILWRPKVWAVLVLLVSVGFGSHLAWRYFAPNVARHPQYQISAERIEITPLPPWIRSDVKGDVLRDAGLAGTISVLEDGSKLQQRLRDAFGFHPWVAAVRRITLGLPAYLQVELEYRCPIAAVEAIDNQAISLLPIDGMGIRLPEADFSEVELRHLPRISGVTGRPVVGAAWNDPCVTGGARIAAGLTDVWSDLRLVAILASPHPQIRGEEQFHTFELLTSGGTRIAWGAAPGREQDADESPFDVKRRRLLDYAADQGRLDSIDGPELLDVRSGLVVVPRTARRATEESGPLTETK